MPNPDHIECPVEEDEHFAWLQGVWEDWELLRPLRQRAAVGRSLLVGVRRKTDSAEVVVGTLKCAQLNCEMVRRLTLRMAKHGVIKNPPLGRLYHEFVSFHQQNGPLTGDDVLVASHADAWGLKRILTLMRRKWSRDEMPRDPCFCKWLQLCVSAGVGYCGFD